ncbi:MAG: DMT family transporter [Methanomassiliicoccales archaeon]
MMKLARDNATKGILLTLLSSLMLGSGYVAAKIGLRGSDPFAFGALAMSVGVLILLVYMAWKHLLTVAMLKRWEFWAAPILNTVVVGTQYVGLSLTAASMGGLIIGMNVIFVALFSRIAFGESLSPQRKLGLVLGMIGLVTLTTKWDINTLSGTALVGDALLIISSCTVAIVVVLSRPALQHMDYTQWTLGLHMLLPVTLGGIALLTTGAFTLGGDAFPAIIWIGIFCSTIPTLLWTGALRHISVVTSATVVMAEAAFSVVFAWIFLGESMDAFVLVGAALIFSAIYFVAKE